MPSERNTAAGRVRISYIEEADIAEELEQIAKESGLNLSDLIREATWKFVKSSGKAASPVTRDPDRVKGAKGKRRRK